MGLLVEDSFKPLTAREANKSVRALQAFDCVSHGNIFANVICAFSIRRLDVVCAATLGILTAVAVTHFYLRPIRKTEYG